MNARNVIAGAVFATGTMGLGAGAGLAIDSAPLFIKAAGMEDAAAHVGDRLPVADQLDVSNVNKALKLPSNLSVDEVTTRQEAAEAGLTQKEYNTVGALYELLSTNTYDQKDVRHAVGDVEHWAVEAQDNNKPVLAKAGLIAVIGATLMAGGLWINKK